MPLKLSEKDIARFWSKVNKLPRHWLWTGAPSAAGYGYFSFGGRKGKRVPAHRVAYELVVGPIPPGLDIDHLCRIRHCIRPGPPCTEPATRQVNLLRGIGIAATNAAKIACVRGHPFDEVNTGRSKYGRYCRTCANTKRREHRRRARERKAA